LVDGRREKEGGRIALPRTNFTGAGSRERNVMPGSEKENSGLERGVVRRQGCEQERGKEGISGSGEEEKMPRARKRDAWKQLLLVEREKKEKKRGFCEHGRRKRGSPERKRKEKT